MAAFRNLSFLTVVFASTLPFTVVTGGRTDVTKDSTELNRHEIAPGTQSIEYRLGAFASLLGDRQFYRRQIQ